MSGRRPIEAGSLEAGDRPGGSASAFLHRKIELVSGPFVAASAAFVAHPRLGEVYPEFLVMLHQVVRATVPVMEAASARARRLSDADPVAAALPDYLDGHADEERGHEEWVLEDLEVLGVPRSLVRARVPSSAVAGLVGSQYYWVLHYHPVALLGYLAVAEGYPIAPARVDDLIARSGHPREAFRMLARHGELDPDHRDELDGVIDSLPLTSDQETALGLSAMSTVGLMARCIEEIVEGAGAGP